MGDSSIMKLVMFDKAYKEENNYPEWVTLEHYLNCDGFPAEYSKVHRIVRFLKGKTNKNQA